MYLTLAYLIFKHNSYIKYKIKPRYKIFVAYTIQTVSYTHLDVYKRQPSVCVCVSVYYRSVYPRTHTLGVKALSWPSEALEIGETRRS